MTRVRPQFVDAVYHVVCNGHPGVVLFHGAADRNKFLEYLGRAQVEFGCQVLAYCVLGTHVHLLVRTPDANLAGFMHRLNTGYSNWFRNRYKPGGHVLKGRYYARVISGERHLHNAAAYIARNAVAAGLADHPGEWAWCSYSVTARGARDRFADPTWLLEVIGGPDYYRALVAGFDDAVCVVDDNGLVLDRLPLSQLLGEVTPGTMLAARESGYTLREIAAATGLSTATVARRTA